MAVKLRLVISIRFCSCDDDTACSLISRGQEHSRVNMGDVWQYDNYFPILLYNTQYITHIAIHYPRKSKVIPNG